MRTILVGVDGSSQSLEAVSFAAKLAQDLNAEVVAASVYGYYPAMSMPSAGYYITDETLIKWKQDLERDLAGEWTEPLAKSDVKFRTVAKEGRPAQVLLDIAKEQNVDLIVVGSRGHGAVAEMVLGSVSHNLVLQAPCPVVVLPHKPHSH